MKKHTLVAMRHQLYQMERMLRSLRQDLEQAITSSSVDLSSSPVYRPVTTSLSADVPTTSEKFAGVVQPYVDFAPGICASYTDGDAGNSIAIEYFSAERMKVGKILDAKCTVSEHTPSKWLTLEVAIAVQDLVRCKQLQSHFSFCAIDSKGLLLPNLAVVLRGFIGGDHTDIAHTTYPCLGKYIEFLHEVSETQLTAADYRKWDAAKFILFLPVERGESYTISISHFDTIGAA